MVSCFDWNLSSWSCLEVQIFFLILRKMDKNKYFHFKQYLFPCTWTEFMHRQAIHSRYLDTLE